MSDNPARDLAATGTPGRWHLDGPWWWDTTTTDMVTAGGWRPTRERAGKRHIYTTPPPRPPEHIHRWAWCQRVDGAEVQRCYDCGVVR